jgi:hypothetical protein
MVTVKGSLTTGACLAGSRQIPPLPRQSAQLTNQQRRPGIELEVLIDIRAD